MNMLLYKIIILALCFLMSGCISSLSPVRDYLHDQEVKEYQKRQKEESDERVQKRQAREAAFEIDYQEDIYTLNDFSNKYDVLKNRHENILNSIPKDKELSVEFKEQSSEYLRRIDNGISQIKYTIENVYRQYDPNQKQRSYLLDTFYEEKKDGIGDGIIAMNKLLDEYETYIEDPEVQDDPRKHRRELNDIKKETQEICGLLPLFYATGKPRYLVKRLESDCSELDEAFKTYSVQLEGYEKNPSENNLNNLKSAKQVLAVPLAKFFGTAMGLQ